MQVSLWQVRGWLHVSQRKHVLAFNLTGWQYNKGELAGGGWQLAGDQLGKKMGGKVEWHSVMNMNIFL